MASRHTDNQATDSPDDFTTHREPSRDTLTRWFFRARYMSSRSSIVADSGANMSVPLIPGDRAHDEPFPVTGGLVKVHGA